MWGGRNGWTLEEVGFGGGEVAERAGSVDPDRETIGGEEVGELFEFGTKGRGHNRGEGFSGGV